MILYILLGGDEVGKLRMRPYWVSPRPRCMGTTARAPLL